MLRRETVKQDGAGRARTHGLVHLKMVDFLLVTKSHSAADVTLEVTDSELRETPLDPGV